MREILFRGKNKCKWFYGDLRHLNDGRVTICQDGEPFPYEVYPETVGQFTGLTDKNGTKIFEGDIVEYEGKRYSFNYLPHYARFSPVKPNTVFCVFAYQRGEVIGNIYDNPELIGGEADE